MKKKQVKQLFYGVLTVLLMLTGFIGGLANPEFAEAAVPGDDVDVTLHKLQFSSYPTEVQNTGELMPQFDTEDPLEGVTFEVYDVTADYHTAFDNAVKGGKTTADAITAAVAAVRGTTGQKPSGKTELQKVTTDADGLAKFVGLPDKSGGKDAVYLFVETAVPNKPIVTNKSPNLVLALPVNKSDGETLNTDIHLYPKNEITTENGKIIKTVGQYDHEIGVAIPFTVTIPLPDKIGKDDTNTPAAPVYNKFEITDTYVSQLDFDASSLVVKTSGDGAGVASKTLTITTDYTLTESSGSFVVALTPAGIAKLDKADENLVLTYNMSLNDTAKADTDYINGVILTTNQYTTDKSEVKVGTGGYRFVKVDSNSGNKLAGAEFVVRDADNDGAKYLKIDPSTKEVTWVTTDTDATVFTSDSNGEFEVHGLKNGTYYLEETKAPTDYTLLKDRIGFTVKAEPTTGTWTTTTATRAEVSNVRKGFLPSTGGNGILSILAVGIVLIIVGVTYFSRRKRVAE